VQLAIRLHPYGMTWPEPLCALCGKDVVAPRRGPELCELHTGDLVCEECGREHAPTLVAILDLASIAKDYAFELNDYQKNKEFGLHKGSGRKDGGDKGDQGKK